MSLEWYCRLDVHELGPLSAAALRELARSGYLRPEHQVRRGTTGSWIVARRVKNLFRLGLRWPAPLGFLDRFVPGPTPRAWRVACTLGLLSITAGYWSATWNYAPSRPLLARQSTSPRAVPAPAIVSKPPTSAPVRVPPPVITQSKPIVPVAISPPVTIAPLIPTPSPPPTPTTIVAATPAAPPSPTRKGGLLDSAELVRAPVPASKSRLFDSSAVNKASVPAATPQP